MNTKKTMVILSSALALGLSAAGTAAADPTPEQARIADSTLKLEKAFGAQFVQGHIDRDALAAPIADVLNTVPEASRANVQRHIENVLAQGEQLTSQMTPEQRAQGTAPADEEHVGKTAQAQIAGWGYPGYLGWGGYGAFGFPYYGLGWGNGIGLGWGNTYGLGYGVGYGAGYGLGYGGYGLGYGGYGLGWGGWGW